MFKFIPLLLIAAFAMTIAQTEIKQTFSPELLMQLKRIGEIKVSPDGKWVLYNLGVPSVDDNKVYRDLYIVSIDGKTTRRITDDKFAESNAFWAKDGKSIFYLAAKSGETQIYQYMLDGSGIRQVSDIETGVSNVVWSPNGNRYVYTADVKVRQSVADKYPKYPKAKIRMYDSIPVREWDEWEDESYSHVFVNSEGGPKGLDIMPGEPYDCPLKPSGGTEQIAWSPDGEEIAYTAKKVADPAVSTNSDIYVYNLKTRTTVNITKGMLGYDRDPLYSPDGRWIAFHSQERAGFESDRVRLMLYDRQNGKITELSSSVDQWVGETIWSPDSKSLFFNAEHGPTVQIYQIEVDGGGWKLITKGEVNYDDGLCITPDGKTLVAGRRTMLVPTEIYTISIDDEAEPLQITHVNDELISKLKKVNIESKTITSTDGKKFHSFVIYPPDFDPNKKYPMITYCQGGPQSTISQYFSYRWNLYLLASQGYVIVAPNRRGMPGFGQAWNDAISKDWGGMPMQDILAATDYMLKEKYIDKNAVAAVGASAGGYAAFWLEGNHKKRFKAFVAHCGVFNMVSKYGSTEELFFPNWEFGGPYWEEKNKAFYEKNSPHNFAANWDTPILIISGEKDFRVPYTQSLEAFTVAQLHKLPSKLIIFPEQNHWVTKPQEAIIWLYEIVDFLDRFCKNK